MDTTQGYNRSGSLSGDVDATAQSAGTRFRDPRIDALRGLALIWIFVDHIPGNVAGHFTMRNFGFADAAELFVLLAGFSAVLAYGRHFENGVGASGLGKVAVRIRDIWFWHVGAMLLGAVMLAAVFHATRDLQYVSNIGVTPFVLDPLGALAKGALLLLQPNLFNILPLYIVLLGLFPVLYLLLRKSLVLGLAISGLIWLFAQQFHVNFMRLSSKGGTAEWVFNPLCWQFLFAIGMAAGLRAGVARSGLDRLTLGLATGYLIFGFIVAAPWTLLPGLAGTRLLPGNLFGVISKTDLSIWRLTHVLALGYVLHACISPSAGWLTSRPAKGLALLGRHSLEVFSVGILLSLAGWIVFQLLGSGLLVQFAVNFLGVGVLGAVAWLAASWKARSSVSRKPVKPASVGQSGPRGRRRGRRLRVPSSVSH